MARTAGSDIGPRSDTDMDGDVHYGPQAGLIFGAKRPVTVHVVDYTLTAHDSGGVHVMAAADKVFSLPATAEGLEYTLVTGLASSTTGLSVSPAAADMLIGNGFTPANDKDAVNTQATENLGDYVRVVGDGEAGWYITGVVGTWARES